MDPVNKWLTTIILFMIATLCVIGWKAGSGRYEFKVVESTLFNSHAVVYVLDTKDGEIYAKMVDEHDLTATTSRAKARPQKVFEIPTYRSNRY